MLLLSVMETENVKTNTKPIQLLGVGLVRVLLNNLNQSFDVVFKVGIGAPLIQNIIELCKKDFCEKKQGNSIIPLDNYTFFVHHFEGKNNEIILLIFMGEKNSNLNYSQLYLFSKKIYNKLDSGVPIMEIKEIFKESVGIPLGDGIIGVFIIGSSGSPYVTKINKNRTIIAEWEVHISGFISALFSFSQEIIGKESGAKLKEINFGNQLFYMITKNNVIFAYLVEKVNPLIQRYMYLVADEFLEQYEQYIINFNGDLSPFREFEKILDQYFLI